MKDCKYRLPCNWCDKYDRMCEAVLLEIYIQEKEENEKQKECEHEWELTGSTVTSNDVINYYTCFKCGEKKSLSLSI